MSWFDGIGDSWSVWITASRPCVLYERTGQRSFGVPTLVDRENLREQIITPLAVSVQKLQAMPEYEPVRMVQ